ncbi:MAG: DEAD/DEAH box helicase, partial [Deltaproteobacteria bacterium]|nr:DEAD/DEAH box helicase [Deltaproteobacteria bacterium]
ASLISNWVNEIKRFSPDIRFFVDHPSAGLNTNSPPKDLKAWDAFDLVITTYALIQRYAWLQTHAWNYIVLDEAQAIKNPGTKQARAVKKLIASNRIIMTGTPIENRLSDLWSLFDFLNPGLLGNAGEFKKFSKDLGRDPSGYARLRNIISPYILRRLKTDKSVISDLPEKVEMKIYAPLGRKQVLLYGKLVQDIRKSVMETEGIQRKGLILSSLMKFKQICNHPDQYLGTGGFEEKESGKFQRLREICETIYEKREKVLVFTQFKEMTQPLHDLLENVFHRKGLILHGSVAVGKRKKIIEQFQSPHYVPFMVLSLKAGGVGLNLTEANHVVHFDRWWNPAVENQATDRAFRIGQKKNVVVHRFLTQGTVEEKIDLMLEEKSRLSQDVIAGTGGQWITEMKNDELVDLFKLSL